ncbi:MAG: DMT family transporter [Xanthobacteraceae bacterium]|nr:DMT family transporter [Xanthobacteraceae bacterium]
MKIIPAISFKLFSTVMFALMGAQARYLEGAYPAGEVAFFRSFFALVPIFIFFGLRGELHLALKTKNPSAHLIRGSFAVIGTFCTFAALARIPIGDYTAIVYSAPLLTVVFSWLVLKEHVHVYRWSAVGIGFCGVLLMLIPYFREHLAWSSTIGLGIIFAFTNACTTAGATIQIRRITATETTPAVVTFMALIVLLSSLTTLPFGWTMPVTPLHWLLLTGIGITGGLGQMGFTESYRYAPASFLAPLDYFSLLWAFVLGYWVFAEVPTVFVLLGAAIVAGAGIFVILRERHLGLKRLREMPVAAIGSMSEDEEGAQY